MITKTEIAYHTLSHWGPRKYKEQDNKVNQSQTWPTTYAKQDSIYSPNWDHLIGYFLRAFVTNASWIEIDPDFNPILKLRLNEISISNVVGII